MRTPASLISTLAALLLGSAAFAAPPKAAPVVVTQRVVEITGPINLDLMKRSQKAVLEFAAQGSEPIWFRINSPGGSVDAGLILVDTMKSVDAPFYCVVESSAYSMAAIILSYCDKRFGLPHATFMLHEASYGTSGEDPQNRSKLDFLTRYLDRMHEEIAKNMNMDLKKYRDRIRNAWWMLTDEAKAAGLIDAVLTSVVYEELPIARTEEKTTLSTTEDRETGPQPTIPKRRD